MSPSTFTKTQKYGIMTGIPTPAKIKIFSLRKETFYYGKIF